MVTSRVWIHGIVLNVVLFKSNFIILSNNDVSICRFEALSETILEFGDIYSEVT